jgi:hypothetical protein
MTDMIVFLEARRRPSGARHALYVGWLSAAHNRDSCIPAMRLLQVGESGACTRRLADVPASC